MRYLGIDYGSAKVGLALSDEAGQMGFPHEVLRTAEAFRYVIALIKEKGVGAVVIGDSTTLAGIPNPINASARIFGADIASAADVPVYWESEVFTSAEAHRQHDSSIKTRKPRSTDAIDASAAAIILTSYLSHTNHGT